MKITDKIITSTIEPQQTNVLWHNPETGELKIFGNKGWEVVGGNPGAGGQFSNGYPVVTIEDNFNIEAKPNTFYNIKNHADSEVSINFKDGYSIEGSNKLLFINAEPEGDEQFMEVATFILSMGLSNLTYDTTKEGYKYKCIIPFQEGGMTINICGYFSDEIKNGSNVNCLINVDVNPGDIIGSLNNIQILNENNDYIIYATRSQWGRLPNIATEIENDSDVFSHKYSIQGVLMLMTDYIYTTEPYTSATNFYIDKKTTLSDAGVTVEIEPNVSLPPSDIANEFVFSVNSPANIIFSNDIKWNNDNVPDLTEEGVCTISIVNGVGCYTFVNN